MSDYRPSVRERLAEQGYELTPEQLVAERQKIYDTICREMRLLGSEPPGSYEEMIAMLRQTRPVPSFVQRTACPACYKQTTVVAGQDCKCTHCGCMIHSTIQD